MVPRSSARLPSNLRLDGIMVKNSLCSQLVYQFCKVVTAIVSLDHL